MNEWQRIINVLLREHVPVKTNGSADWACSCHAPIDEKLTWQEHLAEMIMEAAK